MLRGDRSSRRSCRASCAVVREHRAAQPPAAAGDAAAGRAAPQAEARGRAPRRARWPAATHRPSGRFRPRHPEVVAGDCRGISSPCPLDKELHGRVVCKLPGGGRVAGSRQGQGSDGQRVFPPDPDWSAAGGQELQRGTVREERSNKVSDGHKEMLAVIEQQADTAVIADSAQAAPRSVCCPP